MPMVGLGGSAGSLQCLKTFFENIPADTGMVFVVVLHLSPEHESTLPQLLQRSTSMKVLPAEDGVRVTPNTVYVIPPGKYLSSLDGHLRLTDLQHERGKRVTVDLFLRTMADTHGPHAIAVILSGADADGAIGIKRIKERGGLTIAQDPDEAEHSGMPRAAIATGMVDWVLRVTEMPGRVLEYVRRERRLKLPPEEGPQPAQAPRLATADAEAALRDVLTYLRTRTGRDFTYYKRATILRRISRRMQVNSVEDLPDYLSYLRTHPGEAGALLQDLLISVTNFFRDRECFEALETRIPELFKGKGPNDAVRVWVAACATGEEAYSIAILLCEYARKLETPPIIQVFATDLDEEVVQAARDGVYPETITADVSEERLRRFFIKEHRGYRLRREVREVVLFALHDLLKDSPFSRLDLVSCRNLMIYLNREAQNRLVDIFHFALRPEGRLFLGASESVEDGSPLFEVLDKKHRIYGRRASVKMGLPVPTGPSTLARAMEERDRSEDRPVIPGVPGSPHAGPPLSIRKEIPEQRSTSWSEVHYKLLERIAPPSVLINQDQEIMHLSDSAGRFLQLSGGEPSRNLLRCVHPMLRIELRAALYRAAQTGTRADASHVPFEFEGAQREVSISVSPAHEIAPDFLLVVFQLHEPGSHGREVNAVRAEPDPAARQLERELEGMKSHLRDVVEQYEASTEELKASNQELQAMNEELRSATEELETSREELQSINEELTTVNQELKSKVDELGHTNSDLRNLIGATAIATIFLDRDLRITRYTPTAVSLFKLIPTDVGRPLTDLKHRLEYSDLERDAARVLETLTPSEREVRDAENNWYIARMLPYRTVEDRIAGVVLTFVDITERKRAEHLVEESRREAEAANKAKDHFLAVLSHELRTPLTPIVMAAQMVGEEPGLSDASRESLEMIQRNVKLETNLIDDLLDVTRIARGKMEISPAPMDAHDAINRAIAVCQPERVRRQQELNVSLNAERHTIHADFTRIQQVCWNLLQNAAKFTPDKGVIDVLTRNSDGHFILEVRDSGIGFPPSALATLFDAFSQVDSSITKRYGGLGLGLAIAKASVEAHGGTISASSDGPMRGAIFTVTLPLHHQ